MHTGDGYGEKADGGNNNKNIRNPLLLSKSSLATISLESPPRMTRSIISQSLFQESISSCEEECGSGVSVGKRMVSTSGGMSGDAILGGQTMNGSKLNHTSGGSSNGRRERVGGCGLHFEFLARILDVFSLNGCGLCSDGDNNNMTKVKKTEGGITA